VRAPGKPDRPQYNLLVAQDKTRTVNLRIKFGRINTEPVKSVRGKPPRIFAMYKITYVSLNCGSQAESSPQFCTRVWRREGPISPGSTLSLATCRRTVSRDV
jgi:hypothetical protein